VISNKKHSIRSYHKVIPSQVSRVDGICHDIRAILVSEGLADRCFTLELALREAMNNAILHGNRNQSAKKVELDLNIGRKWIRVSVVDEGPGFNWKKAREKCIPNSEATSGRGLCIIMSCSNKYAYNQVGNRLTFWMQKTAEE
jgi:serine/threonine-protein kinase RsbW